MARDVDRADVIVVGAGPVGLSVALGLVRAGRRVVVLERNATTAEHSRAPAIWPRTQEILSGLEVIDRFLAEGLTLERIRLWDADNGEEILSIPLEELADATPYPRLLILPQSRTERLLCEAVQRHDHARVEFSADVEAVEQDGAAVSVRHRKGGEIHTLAASFAIGCDGAGSTVRKGLGAAFEGETYDTRAALADVRVPAARELPFPRLSARPGLAIGIRMRGDLWRLILPFHEDDGRPLDERVERAAIHLFPEVATAGEYEAVWQSEFVLHRRMASRFGEGRITLAGDAAHLNSPVGGQGMNAGIHDAAALTEALLEALDGRGEGALRDYERERRRAVEAGVNRFTHQLTRLLLFSRGRAIKPVLRIVGHMLRLPPVRRRFLHRIAMLSRD